MGGEYSCETHGNQQFSSSASRLPTHVARFIVTILGLVIFAAQTVADSVPYVLKEIAVKPGERTEVDQYANLEGYLYFPADDGVHGTELWRTDGTPGGTTLVKDINPTAGAELDYLIAMNGILYFLANDGGIYGRQLWRSDGTEFGTYVVNDGVFERRYIFPVYLAKNNGLLFFSADDGPHGRELWVSDGTGNGTRMLLDIYPGQPDGNPYSFTSCGGIMYFSADDGVHSREGWRSDGTEEGTYLVLDIHPTLNGGFGGGLCVDGIRYGRARMPEFGYQPWVSDGTAEGTRLLKVLNVPGPPITSGSEPSFYLKHGPYIYFTAYSNQFGGELYRTDGTAAHTVMVKDIATAQPVSFFQGNAQPNRLKVAGEYVFFSANDEIHGQELWRTDGSEAETIMLADIAAPGSSYGPRNLTDVNGMLYFQGDGAEHGQELWRSDGTPEGTVRLTDLNPEGDAYAGGIVVFNGLLLFRARASVDTYLWAINLGPWVDSVAPMDDPLTNAATCRFRVQFSEDVAGVDAADFLLVPEATLTGATLTGVEEVAPDTYIVTATTGNGQGSLALSLVDDDSIAEVYPEGLRLERNPVQPDGSFVGLEHYHVDHVAPSVLLSTAAPDPTDETPIHVFVVFNEAVTGLESSDFVVTNGTVSNLSGSGVLYQFAFSPASAGELSVYLAPEAAQDLAGNGSAASNTLIRNFNASGEGEGQSGGEGAPDVEGEGEASPFPGACCFSDGQCLQIAEAFCISLSGSYQGAGTVCDNGKCPIEETEGSVDGENGSPTEGAPEGALGPEEGEGESVLEGTRDVEGEGEASPEGSSGGEGNHDGEGESTILMPHSADWNGGPNGDIDLTELLRVIQFFNAEQIQGNESGQYYCRPTNEDGFSPTPTREHHDCPPHHFDYRPKDWEITLSELLRAVQFYNSDGYHFCDDVENEGDGYCVGPMPE